LAICGGMISATMYTRYQRAKCQASTMPLPSAADPGVTPVGSEAYVDCLSTCLTRVPDSLSTAGMQLYAACNCIAACTSRQAAISSTIDARSRC
jgi:hypothetical protein